MATEQLQATLERVNADIAAGRAYVKAGATIPPDLAERLLVWSEGYRELLRRAVKDAEQLAQDEQEPGQ